MDVKHVSASKKTNSCKENHSSDLKSSPSTYSERNIKHCEHDSKEDGLSNKFMKSPNLKIPNSELKSESLTKNNSSKNFKPDRNMSDHLEVIISNVRRDDQPKRGKSLPLNNSDISSSSRKSISKCRFLAHSGISFIPSPSPITSNPFKPIENQESSTHKPNSLISGRKSSDFKTTSKSGNDNAKRNFPPIEKTESKKIVSSLRKSIATIDINSNPFPIQYHNTGHTGLIFKRKQHKRNSMNPFEQTVTT